MRFIADFIERHQDELVNEPYVFKELNVGNHYVQLFRFNYTIMFYYFDRRLAGETFWAYYIPNEQPRTFAMKEFDAPATVCYPEKYSGVFVNKLIKVCVYVSTSEETIPRKLVMSKSRTESIPRFFGHSVWFTERWKIPVEFTEVPEKKVTRVNVHETLMDIREKIPVFMKMIEDRYRLNTIFINSSGLPIPSHAVGA